MTPAEFKKLQKLWYDKLKKDGFEDIEWEGEGAMPVDRFYPRAFDSMHSVQISAIEDYFSMARQFLLEHDFKDEREKVIWGHHSEGLSARSIEAELKKSNLKGKKTWIHDTVARLDKIMKQKYMGTSNGTD